MGLKDDESIHGDLINDLNNMRKVEAPGNFENGLFRRINSNINAGEKPAVYWNPFRIVTAGALVAAAAVIFLLMEPKSPSGDDPLLAQPRVREDVVAERTPSAKKLDEMINNEMQKKSSRREPESSGRSVHSAAIAGLNDAIPDDANIRYGFPTLTHSMIKSGLNFRQVNLTSAERNEVRLLKKKMGLRFQNSLK